MLGRAVWEGGGGTVPLGGKVFTSSRISIEATTSFGEGSSQGSTASAATAATTAPSEGKEDHESKGGGYTMIPVLVYAFE